mmetsp:Transcript_51383/g.164277  ORF Transcript_51383/g.164277 Transcript_51383/m.164277 type:complete len:217 (+) Transcript_51383:333-983(+)
MWPLLQTVDGGGGQRTPRDLKNSVQGSGVCSHNLLNSRSIFSKSSEIPYPSGIPASIPSPCSPRCSIGMSYTPVIFSLDCSTTKWSALATPARDSACATFGTKRSPAASYLAACLASTRDAFRASPSACMSRSMAPRNESSPCNGVCANSAAILKHVCALSIYSSHDTRFLVEKVRKKLLRLSGERKHGLKVPCFHPLPASYYVVPARAYGVPELT